jgi:hypothetical protein
MELIARVIGGHFNLGQRNSAIFDDFVRENPTIPWRLSPILPESAKQRAFFEGAVVPFVAYKQERFDHHKHEDLRQVRERLKTEFNGDLVELGGKVHRVAKSTKGRDQLQPFLERVLVWVMENYEPPKEALDPEAFKVWRDTIFPYGGPSTYMDYLLSKHIL